MHNQQIILIILIILLISWFMFANNCNTEKYHSAPDSSWMYDPRAFAPPKYYVNPYPHYYNPQTWKVLPDGRHIPLYSEISDAPAGMNWYGGQEWPNGYDEAEATKLAWG